MESEAQETDLWKLEIEQLKRKTSTVQPEGNQLNVFYGSSSIRLWTSLEKDLYPHAVVNLGFGGSSYYWCNYYFEEIFEDLKPSRTILYAGDNDLGTGTPEDEIIDNFSKLVSKVKDRIGGTQVAVISVKPSPNRAYLRDRIINLNERIEELINQEGGDFIDIYSKMLTSDGAYRPELFTEDMLHMNEKGYEIWKKEIGMYLDTVQ